MKNSSLILLLVIILAVASALSYYLYSDGKGSVLEGAKQETATVVRQKVSESIGPEHFAAGAPKDRFKVFWGHLQSVDIVRVKAWDTNYQVVWSDLPEIIGERHEDNHELDEAYQGEIELEFAEAKPENSDIVSYDSLNETYVPLVSNQGTVYGVIEVYNNAAPLIAEINKLLLQRVVPIMAAAILLCIILWFALKSRQTPTQVTK